MKKQENQNYIFNKRKIYDDLVADARGVGIPESTAKIIAERVAEKISEWTQGRAVVTIDDLNRKIVIEAKKYNADLAYVYQNRGKII